jgi:multicomponent K+:H+ antiporter subunit G
MSWLMAIALVALLAGGSVFILVGALGLVRLPEFFQRLHGPALGSTMGISLVLLASVGYHLLSATDPQPRELLVTVFLFITSPISAHLMAKAALSLHMAERPPQPGQAAGSDTPPEAS